MNAELTLVNPQSPQPAQEFLTSESIVERVKAVREAMRQFMDLGIDYGVVPGTNGKPTLLKPGAEKLCQLFQLRPEFTIERDYRDKDHLIVFCRCTLIHIRTGETWSTGDGTCSTLEKKYRYFKNGGERYAPDQYNTVLKMAEKRAFVGATLYATAGSGIFTQDMEEAERAPRKSEPDTESEPEPENQFWTIMSMNLTAAQDKLKSMGLTKKDYSANFKPMFEAATAAWGKEGEVSKIYNQIMTLIEEREPAAQQYGTFYMQTGVEDSDAVK